MIYQWGLRDFLWYPYICRSVENENDLVPPEISSKKLRNLGFNYKYGVEDIIHQTITSCLDYGFLSQNVE